MPMKITVEKDEIEQLLGYYLAIRTVGTWALTPRERAGQAQARGAGP